MPGHVVALDSVPPRDRPHQSSLLKRYTHRESVELRFDHKRELTFTQRLLHPRGKRPQLRLRVGLLQTHHPLAMPIGLKQPAAVVAHFRHRRHLAGNLWIRLLPLAQFSLQPIVVPIADLRGCLPMVKRIMPSNLDSQRSNLLTRRRRCHHRRHDLSLGPGQDQSDHPKPRPDMTEKILSYQKNTNGHGGK